MNPKKCPFLKHNFAEHVHPITELDNNFDLLAYLWFMVPQLMKITEHQQLNLFFLISEIVRLET